MNRVAEAECATCHLIRPKSEMRPVRVRRKSASSFGFWQSASSANRGSSDHRGGQSYHTSYAHHEMWVCKGCKKPRSDWTPAHYAFVLFLGFLAWLFFSPGTGTPSSSDLTTNKYEMTASEPEYSEKTDDDGPLAGGESSHPDLKLDELPTPTDTSSEVSYVQFEFNIPEILNAQVKAVSAGRPIRWKAGGYSGYAVPSDVTIAHETQVQCRNVYASATINGTNQQSPVTRMCQAPTGDWVQAD